uniref:Uncharacterized protein n=1 Tax=Arundo donax TaxID=35708 RepID=A0A0A9AR48_ARUDO
MTTERPRTSSTVLLSVAIFCYKSKNCRLGAKRTEGT